MGLQWVNGRSGDVRRRRRGKGFAVVVNKKEGGETQG